MKKFLLNVFLALLVLIFIPKPVIADVPNPNYLTARCNPGEIKVDCSYKSKEPFGPKTYNECAKYENNPNYRFLEGTGSSFGGSQKFCFRAVSTSDFVGYHLKTLLPLVLITLLLEIPLFLMMISKSRKALLTVLFANLISVPLLYIATTFLPFTGIIVLIVMESIVVVFEAVFIKLILKEIGFRKILIYSFAANALSAVFGSLILNIISGLLKI